MGSSNAASRILTGMRRGKAVVLALGIVAAAGQMAQSACAPGRAELQTPDGRVAAFAVEISDTDAERERGLMFRTDLPRGSGMLFVYDSPRHARYWMKNTLIPLDIMFFDAAGVLKVVAAEARPQDPTPIDGGPGTAYVLEVNGGLAAPLGLVPGTRLRAADMAPPLAWPCE